MNANWKDFVKVAREWAPQRDPGTGYVLDDNGKVMTPAAEENQLKGTKYEYRIQTDPRFRRAYDFYMDIAPGIRMRELGVDKLPENEEMAFREILEVPVKHNQDMFGTGEYRISPFGIALGKLWNGLRLREDIRLSPDADAQTLVHELRHALATRIPLGDARKMNDVYGFRGTNIMPTWWGSLYSKIRGDEEMFTTNKEHQFMIYNKLYDELGRRPTFDEYLDATGDSDIVHSTFKKPVNWYEREANEKKYGNERVVPQDFYGSRKMKFTEDLISRFGIPVSYTIRPGDKIPSWNRFMPDITRHLVEKESSKPKGAIGGFYFYPAKDLMDKAENDYYTEFWRDMDSKRKDLMQNVSRFNQQGSGWRRFSPMHNV